MGQKMVCDGCGEERLIELTASLLSGIAGAFGIGGPDQDEEPDQGFGRLMFHVGTIPVGKDLCPACIKRVLKFLGIEVPTIGSARIDRRRRRVGVVGALTPEESEEIKILGLHQIRTYEHGYMCACGKTFSVPDGTDDREARAIGSLASAHAVAANSHRLRTTNDGYKCSCGKTFTVPNGVTGDDVVLEVSRMAQAHADDPEDESGNEGVTH